jgi:hypothetical protein
MVSKLSSLDTRKKNEQDYHEKIESIKSKDNIRKSLHPFWIENYRKKTTCQRLTTSNDWYAK